jgi:hypothetical protein
MATQASEHLARWKYLRFFACILGYRSDLHSSVWGFAARMLLPTRNETGVALCKHAVSPRLEFHKQIIGELEISLSVLTATLKMAFRLSFYLFFVTINTTFKGDHISQLELPRNKEIKPQIRVTTGTSHGPLWLVYSRDSWRLMRMRPSHHTHSLYDLSNKSVKL